MPTDPTPILDQGLGFSGTGEEALAIWEAAARRWPTVARRPTVGDVAVYRRLAGPKLGGRVLILGVTPELRDLAATAGAQPVIVDMSRAMYAATTAMLSDADPARETWIEADWCDAVLPRGGFDLVLGDMVWWALPVAAQPVLRDRIDHVLDRQGLFIGRVRFSEPARAGLDPVGAVTGYLDRLDRPDGDPARIEAEMLSWLYDHTADHAGRRLDRARTRAVLDSLAEAAPFRRRADFLRHAANRIIGADWTSQTKDEIIDLLAVRFELAGEGHAADYDSWQHPILAWRPRFSPSSGGRLEQTSQLATNDGAVVEGDAGAAGMS